MAIPSSSEATSDLYRDGDPSSTENTLRIDSPRAELDMIHREQAKTLKAPIERKPGVLQPPPFSLRTDHFGSRLLVG